MKQKKWLLIIVIIVMAINLSFLVLTRWAKIDDYAREQLASFLASQLEAEVSIGELSFNDKQLNISDLTLQNEQYKIAVEQIYVEYHLLKLLFSRFKDLSHIQHIRIYEPEVEFQILTTEKEENKPFEVPDLQHFFSELTIYDGKFYIAYEMDYLRFEEYFENISITLQNKKKSIIKCTANTIQSGNLSMEAVLHNNEIEEAFLEWYNYQPTDLHFSFFEQFQTNLNVKAVVRKNQLSYHGEMTNTEIEVLDRIAQASQINFEGNLENFTAYSDTIYYDDNLIAGNLMIKDLMTKAATIHGDFQAEEVDLNGFYERLQGFGTANLKIKGKLSRPSVSGTAHCPEFIIANQNIRNVDAKVRFFRDGINISLENAFWFDHRFYGNGTYYFDNFFDFNLLTDHFQWYQNDLIVEGKAQADIHYEKEFQIELKGDEIQIKHPIFSLQNLQVKAFLDNMNYSVEINEPKSNFHFLGTGNFDDSSYQAKINFRRFSLDTFFSKYSLPLLSGAVEVESLAETFTIASSLRLYDKAFGKLDGRFTLDFLRDFSSDTSHLEMTTHNMKFNYEDFHFSLAASGSADSLHTTSCKINEEIELSGWLQIKPSLDYSIKLSGNKISIPDYLKYAIDDYSARQFSGKTTFFIEYDSHEEKNLIGIVQLDKFRYGEMEELQANLQFYGTHSFIAVPQFSLFSQNQQLLGLEGDIILEPELVIKAIGKIDDVELNNLFPTGNVKGLLNGDFLFAYEEDDFVADLDLLAKQINIFGLEADSLQFVCSQKKERLDIVQFLATKRKQYQLQANGSLGYTFWNSKTYQDTNHVNIEFEGDLLKMLANYFQGIQSAKSKSTISLELGMAENGLSINEGFFRLKDAELKLQNQVEIIDRIAINWDIKDNILHVLDWRFRMGEGRLYITNTIEEDDENFMLGMVNLGTFSARTDEKGLLVHIPGYMPFNSVVEAKIKGRYDDYFQITGPFDDLKFKGDILVSNGGIMFPPDLDNILKLFGKFAVERKETESFTSYPFTLDILFHVEENVRYVTYPANIKVDSDNYLHLEYYDDKFHVNNAIFSSSEGSVNMFGTNLEVEQIDVQINPYFDGVHINGLLFKRAVDGTIVTMEVFHNPQEAQTSFLQFRLYSDNPNDSMLDVLAKLRYNRALEEISDEEKKTLLQDEVVQLAGLGLESAILDPLIYPLENQIRKLFRLDMFHVQTGIVRNFFNRYYFEREEEKNYLLREELDNITKFGSEMFLNNLTITMGKYVSRKIFFMYETKFEQARDVAITTQLGIHHSFSLRYDLPKRYKLAYRYKILPFDEKDTHEIALERSFRFW